MDTNRSLPGPTGSPARPNHTKELVETKAFVTAPARFMTTSRLLPVSATSAKFPATRMILCGELNLAKLVVPKVLPDTPICPLNKLTTLVMGLICQITWFPASLTAMVPSSNNAIPSKSTPALVTPAIWLEIPDPNAHTCPFRPATKMFPYPSSVMAVGIVNPVAFTASRFLNGSNSKMEPLPPVPWFRT